MFTGRRPAIAAFEGKIETTNIKRERGRERERERERAR
jgi:hypothetical protein